MLNISNVVNSPSYNMSQLVSIGDDDDPGQWTVMVRSY